MIDRSLVDKLDGEKIIDKRYLFWWQLGFEGRRIFTEDEFSAGLTTVKWHVFINRRGDKDEKEFRLWTRNDVPILVRDVNIDGLNVPCFISVKPASHWPRLDISGRDEFGFPPSSYETPHIRGIAVETTGKHFFWYSFRFGEIEPNYDTPSGYVKSANMPLLASPVKTSKFYRNLVEGLRRRGKRAQQRPVELDYKRNGFTIVPYFEFDPAKMHITFYPANLSPNSLDTPIIVASQYGGKPRIIGAGYPHLLECYEGTDLCRRESFRYWHLNNREQRMAKEQLDRHLGLNLCY
ncbi:MAG: hypothetical protein HYW26_02665 [Candidatus Aenigmarchaeota archaeon]|nr:hypothetical protein [Candidatus Aenigmarchaeota archaeon]